MLTLPKHENYRDSGLEWLGKIPSHWSLQSIRSVTDLKSDRNRPDLPVLSVYREYGVLLKDSRDDNHNATSLDISNYKVVEVGDLVVNKMKAWQGSMGISEHQGIVSPAYITCRVDASKIFPKFLHYLLRSQPYISVYNALSYGVRIGQWDMHYEDFKKIPLPIPDVKEQRRIAVFLDRKTSEIDQAIAQKQRLIELLQEQKAILINQAVTKGLNLNTPMRDSGINWIGKIPQHWEVKKGAYIFRIHSGLAPDGLRLRREGTYLYIKVADLNNGSSCSLIRSSEERVDCRTQDLLPENAIIFPKRGGAIFTNKVRILRQPSLVDTNIMGLSANLLVEPEYLCFLISSRSLAELADISTIPQINNKHISPLKFPVPSREEQRKIVDYIRSIESEYTQIFKKQSREIEVLNELKSALIAEAVTGKIEV